MPSSDNQNIASAKIVHLSTVHEAIDNRILNKECQTLAARGYDVTLIAQHPRTEQIHDVTIVGLERPSSRVRRLTQTLAMAVWKALKERPNLLHFHDPELMIAAPIFRLFGISVVYDVHEDYVTSIRDKSYLGWLRFPLSMAIAVIERFTCLYCHIVVAERSYQSRFGNCTMVLNYPRDQVATDTMRGSTRRSGSKAHVNAAGNQSSSGRLRVLFTGGIHPNRGAVHHAQLVQLHPELEVHLVGRIDASTREQLLSAVDSDRQRLVIDGGEQLTPFDHIVDRYNEGNWLAGLAIFPRSIDHYGKELTKFFEYMAAGIPILCSDFPVWRSLVETHQCGVVVDPDSTESMQSAIEYLIAHPDEVERMGKNGLAAAGQYTWDSQADNLVELYEKILTTGKSAVAVNR